MRKAIALYMKRELSDGEERRRYLSKQAKSRHSDEGTGRKRPQP